MVDQGRLIVFKELSDAQKQGLYERIKSQAAQKYLFQTSCIRSTCTNIEKGTGIKLKGGKPWLPSKIFKRIIHEGFVDKDGNPVEVIYYSVEGKGFQQTLDRLQVREQEILTKVAKWAGGAAVVGATVVVVGGEVIELIFTKDDEI